jgi:hypothetical protein
MSSGVLAIILLEAAMRWVTSLIVVVLLAACSHSSAGADAEDEYNIASVNASNSERCDRANHVAETWLKEKNAEKYKEWRRERDTYCLRRDIERRLAQPN